jgi:hypothetical protein
MNTDLQDSPEHQTERDLLQALARLADTLDRQKAPPPDLKAVVSQWEARRRIRMRRVAVGVTGGSLAAAAAIVLAAVLWPVLAPQNRPTPPQGAAPPSHQQQDVGSSIWTAMSPMNLSLATSLPAECAQIEVATSSPSVESIGMSLLSLGDSDLGEFSFAVPSISLPSWTERSSTNES